MTTKKTQTATKTRGAGKGGSKKTSKPRMIKVVEDTGDGQVVVIAEPESPGKVDKKARSKREPADKRPSALDGAARVLEETTEPMTAKQMVEAMSAKGYWTSPGGKTPHATLYSAILREIKVKGNDSRFTKTERGRFALAVATRGE